MSTITPEKDRELGHFNPEHETLSEASLLHEARSVVYEAAAVHTPESALSETRDTIQRLSSTGDEQSRDLRALERELAAQITQDIQSFTAELNASSNVWTKLTRTLPEFRKFWRKSSVRWARLGLSLGLTATVIVSTVMGLWPAALGALGIRAILGTVSGFVSAQDLQERAERQRQSHSVAKAWNESQGQSVWRRAWGSLKAFAMDDRIAVSAETASEFSTKQARDTMVELVSPMASTIETELDDTQLQETLAESAAQTLISRLTPERYARYERALRRRYSELSDQDLRAKMVERLSTRVLRLESTLTERQAQAERRVKFSAAFAATTGFSGGSRFVTNALQHIDPAQLEAMVASASERVHELLDVEDAPVNSVESIVAAKWVPEGDVPAIPHDGIQLVNGGAPELDGGSLSASGELEALIAEAGFRSDIQRQNFEMFYARVLPDFQEQLACISAQEDMAVKRQLLEQLNAALRNVNAHATKLGQTPVSFQFPGGPRAFGGYDLSGKLGNYLLRHPELQADPVKLYKLLSLNPNEIALDSKYEFDIDAAYERHEDQLLATLRGEQLEAHVAAPKAPAAVDHAQVPAQTVLHSEPVASHVPSLPAVDHGVATDTSASVAATEIGSGSGSHDGGSVASQMASHEVAPAEQAAPQATVTEGQGSASAAAAASEATKAAAVFEGTVTPSLTELNVEEFKPEQLRELTKIAAGSDVLRHSLGYSEQAEALVHELRELNRVGESLEVTEVNRAADGSAWITTELENGTTLRVHLSAAGGVLDANATYPTLPPNVVEVDTTLQIEVQPATPQPVNVPQLPVEIPKVEVKIDEPAPAAPAVEPQPVEVPQPIEVPVEPVTPEPPAPAEVPYDHPGTPFPAPAETTPESSVVPETATPTSAEPVQLQEEEVAPLPAPVSESSEIEPTSTPTQESEETAPALPYPVATPGESAAPEAPSRQSVEEAVLLKDHPGTALPTPKI